MKKIMVISYEFYPVSNGTITCLENILPYLSAKYEVVVFCADKSMGSSQEENLFNSKIVRISRKIDDLIRLKEHMIQIWLYKKIRHEYLRRYILLIIKIIFYVPTLISKKHGIYYADDFEKRTFSFFEKQYRLFDIVITIGAPFENVKIAKKLKEENPDRKWILILFDLYSYNPTWTNPTGIDERKCEELKWFRLADVIVIQPEMQNIVYSMIPEMYNEKIVTMQIPSLKKIDNSKAMFSDKVKVTIDVVYTGMFYEDIRNPEFMLRLFEQICKMDSRIRLHLVGYGCEHVIKKYKKKLKNNLIFYGRTDKADADNVMFSADVLLNISNAISTQTPSKIMEYIGTCKPILNIYSIENDICEKYLADYPIKLGIREQAISKSLIDEVYKYIICNAGTFCDEILVKRCYSKYSAECFANKIIRLIEGEK